jgi:hypothetical protein
MLVWVIFLRHAAFTSAVRVIMGKLSNPRREDDDEIQCPDIHMLCTFINK